MTVKELIAKLEKLPEDVVVLIPMSSRIDEFGNTSEVKIVDGRVWIS
jgi:hypothetical protein